MVVVGVLAAGYYQEFYRPPRVWAGQVGDAQFTMGDIVKRIRVEQGIAGAPDLSKAPFDYLQRLMNAEVLRQESPRLGIRVTPENLDQALRSPALGFYPTVPAGQQTDSGQLEREFQNSYQMFLTRTGLSDEDYRELLEEQLLEIQLYLLLGQDIEETMEQVEVQWIRLEVGGPIAPADVVPRLQVEEFANVAQGIGVSAGYADPSGYVGWVPREAFPEISPLLFGDQDIGQQALPVGQISEPLYTTHGVYIVHVLSGPERMPLSDRIRAKVNTEYLKKWQAEQLQRGINERWLKVKFNDKLYSWVANQVLISAPRNQPEQR